MPDRSRPPFTAEWVRSVLDDGSRVSSREASAVRSLVQGLRAEYGAGLIPRIADAMNAWVESDQSGDPDRPDFWPNFIRVADANIRAEGPRTSGG
jgi:hypothetical protein